MRSAVGIRFDVPVASAARAEAALRGAGVALTSWHAHAPTSRTYARGVSTGGSAPAELALVLGADVTTPPRVALDVRPVHATDVERLESAFRESERSAAVIAVRYSTGLTLEFDAALLPLSQIVTTIDAVVEGARSIEALRPLEDDVLAELSAMLLRDPAIDATRIIERYAEPLLESSAT